jgi:hypothetical protein
MHRGVGTASGPPVTARGRAPPPLLRAIELKDPVRGVLLDALCERVVVLVQLPFFGRCQRFAQSSIRFRLDY